LIVALLLLIAALTVPLWLRAFKLIGALMLIMIAAVLLHH
jgi:hypothetical protein